jgi:hypothetical protein
VVQIDPTQEGAMSEIQMRLAFRNEGLWAALPPDRRERCRKLLSRLLRQVVDEESKERRTADEREDPPVAP